MTDRRRETVPPPRAERSGGAARRVPGTAHLVMHGAPRRTATLIAEAARVQR